MLLLPEPRQIVIVRPRPCVVSPIQPAALPLPAAAGLQQLLLLSPVEDEGLGAALSGAWAREPGIACLREAERPAPGESAPSGPLRALLAAALGLRSQRRWLPCHPTSPGTALRGTHVDDGPQLVTGSNRRPDRPCR